MTLSKIVFDMDGVLVDSRESLVQTYARVCTSLKIEPNKMGFSFLLGDTLEGIFNRLHPDHDSQALSREFRNLPPELEVHPFRGIEALLASKGLSRLQVEIATNKDFTRAEKIARTLNFEFSTIFSPSLGFAPKPDPSMLMAAMSGFHPTQVLFVGDTSTDQAAARAAGCLFAHATWGYENDLVTSEDEFVAHSPEDLLRLIDELAEKQS